jgi:undecaprenyl-diphosphatase
VEWLPLVFLFLAALAAWGFVELANEVVDGELEAFDRTILLAMRTANDVSDPIGPRWFEEFMRDITALGSLGILATLTFAACGYLWLLRKRTAVLYVLVAILGAQALSSSLKSLYDRSRPDLVPHGMYVYTASFPSGHSSMSAATFLTLGALLARYQKERRLRVYLVAVGILLAIAVGVSRVYLSVHWPTDVLAGWAVGAAWALFCWSVAVYLQRRGTIEREAEEPAVDAK